jgi:hypothetical protein
MIFLASVYQLRASENPDLRSTFSAGEIVARQSCDEEMPIFAF